MARRFDEARLDAFETASPAELLQLCKDTLVKDRVLKESLKAGGVLNLVEDMLAVDSLTLEELDSSLSALYQAVVAAFPAPGGAEVWYGSNLSFVSDVIADRKRG